MRLLRFALLAISIGALAACATVGGPDLSEMSFSDEPLIGKFVWYDLITDDVDAAQRFYGGLFGWTFEKSRGPGGNEYVLARDGGVYVGGLVLMADPPDERDFSRWLPYVSVDDVDAAVARSGSAGGRVAVAPLDVTLGRVAAIVDPDGAPIGLARSKIGDPDDPTTAPGQGRVVWTELLASDADEAASFYETVVGYDARIVERRGGEYTMLGADGKDRAGIFENPTDWEPDWLTYFGVEDPAAAAAKAESLGGKVLLEPTPEVREGTVALVSDPSGAVLALQKWPM